MSQGISPKRSGGTGRAASARATGKSKTSGAKKAMVKKAVSRRAADPLERVQRAIERELEKIEAIVGTDEAQGGERTARTLAVLARTLKDVAQISAAGAAKAKAGKAAKTAKTTKVAGSETDDDRMPRDLEQFRTELAKRLDALVAGNG